MQAYSNYLDSKLQFTWYFRKKELRHVVQHLSRLQKATVRKSESLQRPVQSMEKSIIKDCYFLEAFEARNTRVLELLVFPLRICWARNHCQLWSAIRVYIYSFFWWDRDLPSLARSGHCDWYALTTWKCDFPIHISWWDLVTHVQRTSSLCDNMHSNYEVEDLSDCRKVSRSEIWNQRNEGTLKGKRVTNTRLFCLKKAFAG